MVIPGHLPPPRDSAAANFLPWGRPGAIARYALGGGEHNGLPVHLHNAQRTTDVLGMILYCTFVCRPTQRESETVRRT